MHTHTRTVLVCLGCYPAPPRLRARKEQKCVSPRPGGREPSGQGAADSVWGPPRLPRACAPCALTGQGGKESSLGCLYKGTNPIREGATQRPVCKYPDTGARISTRNLGGTQAFRLQQEQTDAHTHTWAPPGYGQSAVIPVGLKTKLERWGEGLPRPPVGWSPARPAGLGWGSQGVPLLLPSRVPSSSRLPF